MSFWESLSNIISVFFWAFIFIAALFTLVSIITDLFRDRDLNGWWKAVWLVFLVFVPLLTALVYVIARGKGMAERSKQEVKKSKEATDEYIREVAGASPSDEIAKAKALLDAGTISAAEYDSLKQHALSTTVG